MRQMSEHDAAFIFSDTAHANSNVTLVHIYDQSTAPGGKVRFKTILQQVETRLSRLPIFRQKPKRVPLDLDYPYWIEDEDFMLEYHVRHLALPQPGDWRQFCIQASRIHARPLDLNRPLWEMYVIEGLDGFIDLPKGSFAVLLKIHHAAIDVEHGSEITMMLHDISATPPAPTPVEPWFPEESPPDALLMAKAFFNNISSPFKLVAPLARLAAIAPTIQSFVSDLIRHADELVTTRFNTVVSPHRVFDTRRFELDEFKTIRKLVPGATVNDTVLAVCAGGLRRYLEYHGELPETTLTGAAPITVRESERDQLNATHFSWVRVQLHTDIEDPVERLAAIHEQTSSSEAMALAVSAKELTDVAQYAPAVSIALTSKMLNYTASELGRHAPLANCTVTNVPGPETALYLGGARLTYFSAIMPIADGMGLVFAVTSYNGKAVVSFTSCMEQMPDPERFAQCVRDSFQEYLGLAAQANLLRPLQLRQLQPADTTAN